MILLPKSPSVGITGAPPNLDDPCFVRIWVLLSHRRVKEK